MAGSKIALTAVSGELQADAAGISALVNMPGVGATGVVQGGGTAAAPGSFSEVDDGSVTASREVLSAEVDKDYRMRVAHDNALDREAFTYTAQNTGKHAFAFTTLTGTLAAAGITTNSGSITTVNTGCTFGTHAMFPVGGTETLVCETGIAFSAQPNANTVIDFGMFQRGASTAFAPLDGFYFRLSAAGMSGVINNNGIETPTAVFPLALGTGTFVYTNNAVNRYLIQANNVSVSFWVNNIKRGEIPTPVGANFPCRSVSLPWSWRHAIVGGAAGAVTQALISEYRIYTRGPQYADSMGEVGNRVLGSYQGMSGGTMGSLSAYTNSTNPTAAALSNTVLTANLPAGLGGEAWETPSLGVNVDGIIMSYQVPAGSATVPGRRLRVTGIRLGSYIQTTLTGGPCIRTYTFNFGHTAVSLATAESASMTTATAKARRTLILPALTQAVTVTQVASTIVSQPGGALAYFEEPIFVNPGEFVQVAMKAIGTQITAGTIATRIQLVYSWE